MLAPNYSFVLSAQLVHATTIAVGDVLIPSTTVEDRFVKSTTAARGTRGSEGIALTAYSGGEYGAVQMQQAGVIDAEISGLAAGAKQLVRVSSAGRIERIASYTASDDVIGYAEADGRVHLHFGLPWGEIAALAGGGSASVGTTPEVQLTDGAGAFLAATRVTGGTEWLAFGTGTKPSIGHLRFPAPTSGAGNDRILLAQRKSDATGDLNLVSIYEGSATESSVVFGDEGHQYVTLVAQTAFIASQQGPYGGATGSYFGVRPDGLAFLSLSGGANQQFEMSSNIITDYALEFDPDVTGVVECKTSSGVTNVRWSFYRGGAPVRWLNANSLQVTLGYEGANAVPIRFDADITKFGSTDTDLLTTIKPDGQQTTDGTWTTLYSINLNTADDDCLTEFWFKARCIAGDSDEAAYFERHRAFRMDLGTATAYPETQVRTGGDTIVADARISLTGTTVSFQVQGDTGLTLDWTGSIVQERSLASGAIAFSPVTDTASECLLWLRSDLGLTADGGTLVSAWLDQSGQADANRDAAAAGSARPGYTASNVNYNGHPTVDFTSAAHRLATGTWDAAVSQQFTVFVVGRAISSGSNAYWFESLDGASHIRENNGAGLIAYAGTVLADGTTNAPAIIAVTYNGASTIIQNSKRSSSVTGAAGAGGLTGMYLGNETGSGGYLNGEVAEYIVFAGALSAGDMTNVLDYLEARYDIALAA